MFGRLFLINAVVLLVFMTAGWLVAKRRDRLDTVDTAWGLGFILMAWIAQLYRPSSRSLVIATLVTIWGLRLSWHLWNRNHDRPDDPRYRELSDKWQGDIWRRAYFSIFLLQGGLIWLISLPIVVATEPQLLGGNLQTLAGTWIWLVGFGFEAIADWQLTDYRRAKKRPMILQTGLWRYSRHPNYFGELAQWWGISLIALQASYGWLGLVGPIVLTILIVFVSGIPPIERRHAKDPAYRGYRRDTSLLIPWPPRSEPA